MCESDRVPPRRPLSHRHLASLLLLFLHVLARLFWGAPLVAREVEHGTYPADRFWLFQGGIETALSLVLVLLAVRLVRRRLA
jgi:hypothetical protein